MMYSILLQNNLKNLNGPQLQSLALTLQAVGLTQVSTRHPLLYSGSQVKE